MHFSIPDTQELYETNGSVFMGYNIHINGVFHCCVRYKQLRYLNEQLRNEFGAEVLPAFPPKKLLPLTRNQLEERRVLLEKFIQTLGQDPRFVTSELLMGFLLSAQQETTCQIKQELKLEVHTMNNCVITLKVMSTESTEQVLLKVCKQIHLPVEFVHYFSLFLVLKFDNGEIILLRKLQDFESPYISHVSCQEPNRILLRKSYWDSNYDSQLMSDPVSLNLLYIQTVSDLERGWIQCPHEMKMQLVRLQAGLAKKEYIQLAQSLKFYGFIQFHPCYSDYPKKATRVLVAIGKEELNLRLLGTGQLLKEGSFKITRMRCWRITATHNKVDPIDYLSTTKSDLELSFEYLMSKDKLEWITIASEQAILMSVCLQSMVDELLLKKGSKQESLPVKGNWSYMKRDGSSQRISLTDPDVYPSSTNDEEAPSAKSQEVFSIKKLQEKFSSVSFKAGKEFVENHAFEGIGDDDL